MAMQLCLTALMCANAGAVGATAAMTGNPLTIAATVWCATLAIWAVRFDARHIRKLIREV
jgi:hypothetical protein